MEQETMYEAMRTGLPVCTPCTLTDPAAFRSTGLFRREKR
jgi:hypothetical protein